MSLSLSNPSKHDQCLPQAYDLLSAAYGHQRWWPADSPLEVCVGAILTQNTSWSNVERAIRQLKSAGCLTIESLSDLPTERLAQIIRPAGYFNVKARRLKAFVTAVKRDHAGLLDQLLTGPTATVRARLLDIKGVGPETADSMLLYAGSHPSFVVDAYTRRIFSRHGWCRATATYDDIKLRCETSLARQPVSAVIAYWGDFHAQLVNVAKLHCRKTAPVCAGCPLEPLLPTRNGSSPRGSSATFSA